MHHCDAAAEPHCAPKRSSVSGRNQAGAETQVTRNSRVAGTQAHTAAIVDGCNRELNAHKQQPSLTVDVNPGQRRVNPLLAGLPV